MRKTLLIATLATALLFGEQVKFIKIPTMQTKSSGSISTFHSDGSSTTTVYSGGVTSTFNSDGSSSTRVHSGSGKVGQVINPDGYG